MHNPQGILLVILISSHANVDAIKLSSTKTPGKIYVVSDSEHYAIVGRQTWMEFVWLQSIKIYHSHNSNGSSNKCNIRREPLKSFNREILNEY